MFKFLVGLFLTVLTINAFAGVHPDMLVRALNSSKVKEALKDVGINSIKLIYDKPGRAAFDYTILICGVAMDEKQENTLHVTTKVDGLLAYYPENINGQVSQVIQKTVDPICQ